MTTQGNPDPQDDLEKLAAELDGQTYALGRAPRPQPVCTYAQPARDGAQRNIYAGDGFSGWGWGERVAPVTDLAAAAQIIARLLPAVEARNG